MKYLAHLENSLDSDVISIYDVQIGMNSKNPEIWEKREYYSLWYLNPMIARATSLSTARAPHFAFKHGFGGNENSGGGESLEHDLAKKTVFDLKKINIRMWGKNDYLHFSEMKIEHRFEDGKYISDLYAKIDNENKFGYAVGTYLAIELHWKNKVDNPKIRYFRKENIAIIQIDLNKAIKYEGDLSKLQTRITRFFETVQDAKSLHDPNYLNNLYEINKAKEKRIEKKQVLKKIEEPLLNVNAVLQHEIIQETPILVMPMTKVDIHLNKSAAPVINKRLTWLQMISKLLFGKTYN